MLFWKCRSPRRASNRFEFDGCWRVLRGDAGSLKKMTVDLRTRLPLPVFKALLNRRETHDIKWLLAHGVAPRAQRPPHDSFDFLGRSDPGSNAIASHESDLWGTEYYRCNPTHQPAWIRGTIDGELRRLSAAAGPAAHQKARG